MWIGYFAEFGYPAWFSYAIGALEIAGVALLLIPRIAPYAALGLVVIMLGALQAVTTHETALGADGPIVHLVLLGIILAGRWRGRWGTASEP